MIRIRIGHGGAMYRIATGTTLVSSGGGAGGRGNLPPGGRGAS